MFVDSDNNQQLASDEAKRIDGYKEIYTRTHEFPDRNSPKFFAKLGLDAVVTGLTSVGALILAAVRTATIFYASELLLLRQFNVEGTILASVAMVSALLAVEGYLFAIGLRLGKTRKDVSNLRLGLFFAFGISILAGITASFPLASGTWLPIIEDIFSWALVAATGIGATFLAFFGAENFGAIWVRWDQIQKEVDEEFEENKALWYKGLERDYRTKGRGIVFGEEDFVTRRQKGTIVEEEHNEEVSQKLREWMHKNAFEPQDVGQGTEYPPALIARHINMDNPRGRGAIRTALSRMKANQRKEIHND